MSGKKKTGSAGKSSSAAPNTQDFSLERPLQTVILALSPLVFRSVFSPETTLLDLLVNLAPSVSGVVVVTTREYADRVQRGRVFVVSDSRLSEAAILRELWGTGIGCPVSGDFLLLRGDRVYANFFLNLKKFPKNAERVMTRYFQAASTGQAVKLAAGTGEILEISGLAGKPSEDVPPETHTVHGNLHADVFSAEVFKILADQLDWEISDLPGNLLFSKYHDMISGEFSSGVVLSGEKIGNFHNAGVVSLVLKNFSDFFPVRPSRKVGNSSVSSTACVEQATSLENCVVTGPAELIGNFSDCVISGRAKLTGNFRNCLISGTDIFLLGDFSDCVIVEDAFTLETGVRGLCRVLGERMEEISDSSAPQVASAAAELGEGDFTSEVQGFIFETSEADADAVENTAKQLRIFRTTQNETVERLAEAVALAVARKSLAIDRSAAAPKTSERQKAILGLFEVWAEGLEMMYLEQEYLESVSLDFLARECGEEFWLVLWAMYQSDFLVDRKSILDWSHLDAARETPGAWRTAGLGRFLAFLEDTQSSSSEEEEEEEEHSSD